MGDFSCEQWGGRTELWVSPGKKFVSFSLPGACLNQGPVQLHRQYASQDLENTDPTRPISREGMAFKVAHASYVSNGFPHGYDAQVCWQSWALARHTLKNQTRS